MQLFSSTLCRLTSSSLALSSFPNSILAIAFFIELLTMFNIVVLNPLINYITACLMGIKALFSVLKAEKRF